MANKYLFHNELKTMPKTKLPNDFLEMKAPEISIEKIVETIRSKRDEY